MFAACVMRGLGLRALKSTRYKGHATRYELQGTSYELQERARAALAASPVEHAERVAAVQQALLFYQLSRLLLILPTAN